MTRAILFLKAAIPILLLAVVAPSTTGLQVGSPGTTTITTQTGTYTVTVAPNQENLKSAVERLPKSQLAWNFATLPDGTKVISGPNGAIWRGQLPVGMGPMNPPGLAPSNPGYRLYITPSTPGQKPFYEIVPPSGQPVPKLPNLAPILPPGKSQPHFILPKITP